MIISNLTKYFLWFFIFNIAQYPQRVLTSYMQRCGAELRNKDFRTLIGPVCSENYSNFTTCLEKNLHKSAFDIDKKFYNSIDFTNLKKKTAKFCSKFDNFDIKKNDCDTRFIRSTTSSNFCSDEHIRLQYLKLNKCPVNVRLLWFNYRDSIFRNGCQIIDPWYQVIPKYGPEIVCYKNFIRNYGNMRTDNTSLFKIFEKFCQEFDYRTVFNCVNQTYDKLSFHEFGGEEKKRKYECAAKMFVDKRRELCERFHSLKQKPPKSKVENILKCKKLTVESRISSKEILATKYTKCLSFDSALTKLVFDNLMSFEEINLCRANSSYFEYLISTRNRAGFHLPTVELLLLVYLTLTFVFLE